jgi:hypothetical protein
MSLTELGRFAEAAKYEAEAIRLDQLTQHAFTIGFAHLATSAFHLATGDWTQARSMIERWIGVVRAGTVVLQLPYAVACAELISSPIRQRRPIYTKADIGQ